MSEKVDSYIIEQTQGIVAFRKVLTSESDRGCALFAAAHLDISLSDLLYVSLVENKSIERDLFQGTAPLSSFSSRIKLAFYLGLISRNSRRDLDIIRGVRNDFAHSSENICFSTQSVHDRCKNLSFSYHDKDADPRAHFTAASTGLLARIRTAILTARPHLEKPDDTPSEEYKEQHRNNIEKIAKELGWFSDDSPKE